MSDRAEFGAQRRTSETILADLAELKVEFDEVNALLRRIAHHLGIDPNGDDR